jgi:hypothetical protein
MPGVFASLESHYNPRPPFSNYSQDEIPKSRLILLARTISGPLLFYPFLLQLTSKHEKCFYQTLNKNRYFLKIN